jgi:ABC-type multidrug transport system ATPase subunit
MYALMGKLNDVEGTVTPDMQKCKSVIGFVPQEDIMMRELTVRENMMFSARARSSRSLTSQQIHHVCYVIVQY